MPTMINETTLSPRQRWRLALKHSAPVAMGYIPAGIAFGVLMDLTGMDVNFTVSQFLHQSHFADPRLRSTPLHRYMLETGQLGRKTEQGFFSYAAGASGRCPQELA